MRQLVIFLSLAIPLLGSCNKAIQPTLLLTSSGVPINYEKSYYLKMSPTGDKSWMKYEKKKPSKQLPAELGFLTEGMQAKPAQDDNFAATHLNSAGSGEILSILYLTGVKHTPYSNTYSSDLTEGAVVDLVRSHYAKENISFIEWARETRYFPRRWATGQFGTDGYSQYEFEVPSQKLLVELRWQIVLNPEGTETAWQISAAKLS